jgi:hypothetical protein
MHQDGFNMLINLFQILNYKMTMTIEKWLKEEKMRLGRFKIHYVNAQKKKQNRYHLRCLEVVGVDSIAPGMIH